MESYKHIYNLSLYIILTSFFFFYGSPSPPTFYLKILFFFFSQLQVYISQFWLHNTQLHLYILQILEEKSELCNKNLQFKKKVRIVRLKVELFFYSVACVVFPPGTTVSKLLTSKSLWPTKLCLNTCSIAFVKITNEWCIYIALLLCIAIHPKRFTIMWGGLSSTTTSGSNPEGSFTACLLKKIFFSP